MLKYSAKKYQSPLNSGFGLIVVLLTAQLGRISSKAKNRFQSGYARQGVRVRRRTASAIMRFAHLATDIVLSSNANAVLRRTRTPCLAYPDWNLFFAFEEILPSCAVSSTTISPKP